MSQAEQEQWAKSIARATSQEQSKSRAKQENLPSEEELIFRRRWAAARRCDASGQATTWCELAAAWPGRRDTGGRAAAWCERRRRLDAGYGGGVTQAAMAARLEHSSRGLCLRGARYIVNPNGPNWAQYRRRAGVLVCWTSFGFGLIVQVASRTTNRD